MEERAREILFKTRRHAAGTYFTYPPALQQPNEEGRGSFLSFLSPRAIVELKERWTEYRNPRKLQKFASLFVSPTADHVAVAFRNQITFLRKDNDYQEPTGTFNSGSTNVFVCGAWSEAHDILAVVDDRNTVYFIKTNGEEITRITKKHLKMYLPILGLILQDETDAKKSCMCTFSILTSDGLLHDVEISQDPSACVFSAQSSRSGMLLKKQVFCLDYSPRFSLFATVSTAGSVPLSNTADHPGLFCLSLWQRSSCADLELIVSTEFEGLYTVAKDYMGWLTYPKLLISPQRNFIACLDARGCLLIFKFHEEQCSLSSFSAGKMHNPKIETDMSSREREFLRDTLDFTWWSDDIIAVARRDGTFTVFDVCTGFKLSENDPVYTMPLLERVPELAGHLFLLESKPSSRDAESSVERAGISLCLKEHFDCARLSWNLVSFSETSVSEMYDILIRNKEFQNALGFADRHGLNKDEVLKSQWLLSGKGVKEINTLLSTIKDQAFVLSECINSIGPTEDAMKVLLAFGLRLTDRYKFCVSEDDECSHFWDFRLARLKLLQFRDRLETFLGINMGRFSVQDYNKFRSSPINEAAIPLAEKGKIGALNLLFKRHPFSLSPFMLDVLSAIPETVPVQTYAQLLPGNSPPASNALREEDWVECDKMISFIDRLPKHHSSSPQIRTEPIVRKYTVFQWPSTSDLSLWYKSRAREIDSLSGQLDNSMCLIDMACRKGISELQRFLEDITYLHQLIYSDDQEDTVSLSMTLSAWEQLPDYEKFKMMLMGVKEENVLKRLQESAIPFMKRRSCLNTTQSQDTLMGGNSTTEKIVESFLVQWLKEISSENKLEICMIVIGEGFTGVEHNCFMNESEVVDCALQCIYMCSATDRWNTMSSILSKLPLLTGSDYEVLKSRLKLAEGHIEAGRLLSIYQVPKPINFFLEAHLDEKGVKQIFRLILSKFIRRQLGRSDNDWTNMWHDLVSLQEKAFPFLDLEYVLIEFCRGLLKAGKFSLASNYLSGTASVRLAADKGENLVIQAAREYFFSASSLDSQEIWKAKECLKLSCGNRNVRAEIDIIDAVTMKLPNLGVHILPVQFRQMKDSMEIIKRAITSQPGAYLNVDELIEVAKLLGLNSSNDILAVQEAIAREAAVAGDFQLAFDLCVVLAKKGHGSVWDLCAALAKGPALENMDISSRKHLLGFALSHCDEKSIGELLHAWKGLDMQGQCESLMLMTGREPPEAHGSSNIFDPSHSSLHTVDIGVCPGKVNDVESGDQEAQFSKIKELFSVIAKDLSPDNPKQWEFLRDNGKIFSFAVSELPWLLELSSSKEIDTTHIPTLLSKKYVSIRTQAVLSIISWLAMNGFAPRDDLIASLAKSIMEPPVTKEEDILGCSFLLNLVDAFYGVNVIEEFVKIRDNYDEINSIMNMGMIYGLLNNRGVECLDPGQRRMLLHGEFQQNQRSVASDERDQLDKAQSTFWKEWKMKLEEQKQVADQSRILEQIIPGVETARFLSGDMDYIEKVVFFLIESLKLEKKHMLKDVTKLVDTYGLDKTKVLLHYMSSILISECWPVEDVLVDLSELKNELLASAPETIEVITLSVYPMIDGHDKQRLACIYGLLSECYLQLERKEPQAITNQDLPQTNSMDLAHFCKIVEQECYMVSFIQDLNFKRIAGLHDLNWDSFNGEICSHIDESNVEALANMVHNLLGIYGDSVPKSILSWHEVYRHHVFKLMTTLETRSKTEIDFQSSQNIRSFLGELEQTYGVCHKYVKFMEFPHVLDLMKQFFTIILGIEKPLRHISFDSTWQECLIMLLNLWLRLAYDFRELKFYKNSDEIFSDCLIACLKDFVKLIIEGKVSPREGWGTVVAFISSGLTGGVLDEVFEFCRAMVFSGCTFLSVAEVFVDAIGQLPPGSVMVSNPAKTSVNIQDLPHLYLSILETVLPDLATGSLQQQKFHFFLSSLSKLEGNLEELKRVRHAVWERIAEVSDNLQLPSHIRVYILELMQIIAATGKHVKGHSSELEASVLPWEGWEDLQNSTVNREKTTDDQISNIMDTSNRFKNTLVALKSSQLLSVISPSMEITTEDLLTTESAVSCFLKVSNSATSKSHVDALVAMLGEWDGLFVDARTESPKLSDDGNGWSNDDWDEGWESFQEELKEKEMKDNSILSVHPLHACWLEIFKKMIVLSSCRELLKLIDQYRGQTMQILLDEDGARCLSQITLDIDCILALKVMLLFPFEAVQLQCLDAVENMIKQRGISDEVGHDHELLVLVLSSGIITKIINRSSYGTIFSYLCYLVGKFSRLCQEAYLSSSHTSMTSNEDEQKRNLVFIFTRLLFPCYISELVKADQLILAGFLVTKLMHTNASVSLVNVAEASLRRYLQDILHQIMAQDDGESSWEGMMMSKECLLNSVFSLRGRLVNLVQSALSVMASN